MQASRKACGYCGSDDYYNDDHVPPKTLFKKPRPSNLITVPACRKCHEPTTKDDEYFRNKLCMSDATETHPDAEQGRAAAFRAIERPEALGLRKAFIGDIFSAPASTPSGLYVGMRFAYDVDLERICRTAERIVRGIFFFETSRIVGKNCGVAVHNEDSFWKLPRNVIETFSAQYLSLLREVPSKIIGNNTFAYKFLLLADNPEAAVWRCSFFNSIEFVALISPLSLPEKQ